MTAVGSLFDWRRLITSLLPTSSLVVSAGPNTILHNHVSMAICIDKKQPEYGVQGPSLIKMIKKMFLEGLEPTTLAGLRKRGKLQFGAENIPLIIEPRRCLTYKSHAVTTPLQELNGTSQATIFKIWTLNHASTQTPCLFKLDKLGPSTF